MTPAKRDLAIYRGDDYTHQITFQDSVGAAFDVSGYTFAASVRQTYDAPTATAFAVDTSDAATGVLVLSLTEVQSAALPAVARWDLQATASGITETWLAGVVTLTKDVTHA